jgi:polyisoprenoid-binding protein YceI
MTKQTKWSIDQSHSEIGFKVRHLMASYLKGTFKIFDANIYTTAKDFTTANINLWIDASSITTGDDKRDKFLKGADFFDVKNHQLITFTACSIGKMVMAGTHELWGELTIKGNTRLMKLDVAFGGIANDAFGNEKAKFKATGKINRSHWGLIWNANIETGGFIVSEEIAISCEVELTNLSQKELIMGNRNILVNEI